MMMQTNRARGITRAAAALAAIAFVSACNINNELLQPQNPGIVDNTAVGSAAAAAALKVGAMGRLKWVVSDPSASGFAGSSIWEAAALMSDEFMNSDFQNSQNDLDARTVDPTNSATNYIHTTQARGSIRDAIKAEQQYEPQKTADIGELYMAMGFLEMTLAENFCNGIPLGSIPASGVVDYSQPDFKPLTNAQVYTEAVAHYDSALTILGAGTDVNTVAVRTATLIAKARTLVDEGQYAAAAALVPSSVVPTTYQYVFITQGSSNSDDLGFWTLNNSVGRYSVGDSSVVFASKTYTTLNAIPFASMKDPRVPVVTGASLGLQAEDGATPFFLQQVYKGRDDPIPMVSGLDARLIEAEAKLNTGDYAGMMTILNALRTAPPKSGNFQAAAMTALATPATKDAAINLFFREKALWQYMRGYRLSDLRRLVRQYGRTQDKVFPSGQQYKGVPYGQDVNFPVPDAERPNPQFSGCIDRNA